MAMALQMNIIDPCSLTIATMENQVKEVNSE
jgi:hypothetical protein